MESKRQKLPDSNISNNDSSGNDSVAIESPDNASDHGPKAAAPQARCRLLELPAELRSLIFKRSFEMPYTKRRKHHLQQTRRRPQDRYAHGRQPPISRVCRQIRDEVLKHYYEGHTIRQMVPPWPHSEETSDKLRRPSWSSPEVHHYQCVELDFGLSGPMIYRVTFPRGLGSRKVECDEAQLRERGVWDRINYAGAEDLLNGIVEERGPSATLQSRELKALYMIICTEVTGAKEAVD